MRSRLLPVACLFSFVLPALAYAQTTDVDITPLAGRLVPTTPPTQAGIHALMGTTPRTKFVFSPLYLTTDGAWLGQLTAGAVFPTTMPVRASLTYTYISPDGTDHLNSYGASLRATVWSKDSVGGVTLLGAYSDTQDASTKAQAGAVGEFKVAGPLSLGADIRWVRSSSGAGIDDIVPKITAAVDHNNLTFGVDYTFENDVDGENDYSAELDASYAPGTFFIGAGKHSTWYLGFSKTF